MTVELFTGKDPQGRIWEPDFSHEVHAAIRMIGKAWRAFHAAPELYLLAFNLHSPNIDMLVISERGIGLLEMKGHRGAIRINPEDHWLADGQKMLGFKPFPGRERPASSSYLNPHDQVQGHGERFMERFLPVVREQYPELTRGKRRGLRLQTCVCFTNPEADLAEIRKVAPEWSRGRLRSWESDFSVISADEVPEWISTLRFEVKQVDSPPYYPFRLTPAKMRPLLLALFSVERWKSVERILPVHRYGQLRQISEGRTAATYSLWEEETFLGRDPLKCTIVVPQHYTRVSRVHAVIRREADEIILEDLDSHNGTYLDGRRITGKAVLREGMAVSLGGRGQSQKECRYEFHRTGDAQEEMDTTEDGTRPHMFLLDAVQDESAQPQNRDQSNPQGKRVRPD
ncbi:MAG: FHA domain-containing protein [Anaerolineales bacterium]|nr:FHA domain-containing protein [Anaerolineales bacterium]